MQPLPKTVEAPETSALVGLHENATGAKNKRTRDRVIKHEGEGKKEGRVKKRKIPAVGMKNVLRMKWGAQ